MNEPTPEELRTAAKVKRWLALEGMRLRYERTVWERLWTRLFYTDLTEHTLKQADILEEIADELEAEQEEG